MHGTFNEKITHIHRDHKDKGEKRDDDKIVILIANKKKGNVEGNNDEIEEVETFSLFSVGDIHIAVSSGFYIPIHPQENRKYH